MEDKHTAEDLLRRLAFIGSSTTAGYGLDVRFAEVFESLYTESRHERHKRLQLDCADGRLRRAPERLVEKMVLRAIACEPTLVVAIDLLFWFVYGPHPDRLAMLERGLKLLERLPCPVAVGTIPAIPPTVIEGLPQVMRPTPGELQQANERITAWVAECSRRILVPFAEIAALHPTRRQVDDLHTDIHGLDALARAFARMLVSRNLVRREFFADRIIQE